MKQGLSLKSADLAEFHLMVDDPSRVLVRQLFGASAQYDKAMLVAQAKSRKKAKGTKIEGQKPLGSRPDKSYAIEQMKALRAEGFAFDRIAGIKDN